MSLDLLASAAAFQSLADACQRLATLFAAAAPTPPAPPQPPTPATGGLPILTPARLAVLAKMRADEHVYWTTLQGYADRTVAGNPIYDDLGQAAAIVYRVTRDASYAAAAWKQLQAAMAKDGRAANDVRQRYVDYQLIYAWVADSLSAADRAAFATTIQQWSDYCLGRNQKRYVGSFRLSDSDQTIGQYFGLALQDALQLAPGNLTAQRIENLDTGEPGAAVGGLTATSDDGSSTVRNAIDWYASVLAAGGEWPESSQYDLNTVMLLVTGWLAHWDATGANSFPELSEWAPAACRAALVDWTPALEARVLWGDNDADSSSGPDLYKALPYLAALAAAAARVGATDEAAQIAGLLAALEAKYPVAVSQAEIHFFFFCDAYAATAAFRTPDAAQSNYSPGVGLYRRIDGDRLFFAYSPSRIDIDHEFNLVGDLGLFAGGEWVVGEPVSYGGTGFAPQSNSMTVSGISAMYAKGFVARVGTPDYTYLQSLSAGPLYGAGQSWNPPPVWCRELRRTLLYLPALDAIFVCDRLDSDDPTLSRPDFTGYTADDEARIKASTHRHEWFWNCIGEPTLGAGYFSYATPGKQTLRCDYYSAGAAELAATSYDERAAWSTLGIPPAQLMWGVSLAPASDEQYDCALWCLRLNPSAAAPAPVSIGDGAQCRGWLLGETAVLFAVAQGAPQLDPATPPIAGAKTTYLCGCAGSAAIVIR